MIFIKKFISVFLCVVLFSSFTLGAFATSDSQDSNNIKGIIYACAVTCGFEFQSWQEAYGFANSFYNKILEEQTEKQLLFLSKIPDDSEFETINNNFKGVVIGSALLLAFKDAVSETYDLNFDSSLGDVSNSIKIPYQYYFGNYTETVDNEGNTIYLLEDFRYDVSDLTTGLTLWKRQYGDNNIGPQLYLYCNNDFVAPMFKLGDYYFKLKYDKLSIPSYNVGSIVPYFSLQKITNKSGFVETSFISLSNWNPFGGYSLIPTTGTNDQINYSICLGFAYYDNSGNLLGCQWPKTDSTLEFYCDTLSNILDIFNNSSSCAYTSIESLIDNDILFSGTTLGTYPISESYLYNMHEFLVPLITDWSVGLKVPFMYSFSNNTLYARYFEWSYFFNMMYSYVFTDEENYCIGSLMFDSVIYPINASLMSDSDSFYNRIISEGIMQIRIPYNFEQLSEDSAVTLSPIVDDLFWNGFDTSGGSDSSNGSSSDSELILPDLDDSTILDFVAAFVDSIGNFFSFGFNFISSLPSEVLFVILGATVSLICIGVIKLVL